MTTYDTRLGDIDYDRPNEPSQSSFAPVNTAPYSSWNEPEQKRRDIKFDPWDSIVDWIAVAMLLIGLVVLAGVGLIWIVYLAGYASQWIGSPLNEHTAAATGSILQHSRHSPTTSYPTLPGLFVVPSLESVNDPIWSIPQPNSRQSKLAARSQQSAIKLPDVFRDATRTQVNAVTSSSRTPLYESHWLTSRKCTPEEYCSWTENQNAFSRCQNPNMTKWDDDNPDWLNHTVDDFSDNAPLECNLCFPTPHIDDIEQHCTDVAEAEIRVFWIMLGTYLGIVLAVLLAILAKSNKSWPWRRASNPNKEGQGMDGAQDAAGDSPVLSITSNERRHRARQNVERQTNTAGFRNAIENVNAGRPPHPVHYNGTPILEETQNRAPTWAKSTLRILGLSRSNESSEHEHEFDELNADGKKIAPGVIDRRLQTPVMPPAVSISPASSFRSRISDTSNQKKPQHPSESNERLPEEIPTLASFTAALNTSANSVQANRSVRTSRLSTEAHDPLQETPVVRMVPPPQSAEGEPTEPQSDNVVRVTPSASAPLGSHSHTEKSPRQRKKRCTPVIPLAPTAMASQREDNQGRAWRRPEYAQISQEASLTKDLKHGISRKPSTFSIQNTPPEMYLVPASGDEMSEIDVDARSVMSLDLLTGALERGSLREKMSETSIQYNEDCFTANAQDGLHQTGPENQHSSHVGMSRSTAIRLGNVGGSRHRKRSGTPDVASEDDGMTTAVYNTISGAVQSSGKVGQNRVEAGYALSQRNTSRKSASDSSKTSENAILNRAAQNEPRVTASETVQFSRRTFDAELHPAEAQSATATDIDVSEAQRDVDAIMPYDPNLPVLTGEPSERNTSTASIRTARTFTRNQRMRLRRN